MFHFLENLDQPPGFPKGSWMKKKRKVIRQDYTSVQNDDVICITEVTDQYQSKDSKDSSLLEAEINVNSLPDMTGPSSPHDSGYSTSVSTNGTVDSLSSSSSSRRDEDVRSKLYMDSSKKLLDDRTQGMTAEGGSILTTTAVIHSELIHKRNQADSEDEVFYDAVGDISANTHLRGGVQNGSVRTEHSKENVDGQCLSLGSHSECNSEGEQNRGRNTPSTPPPSPSAGRHHDSKNSSVVSDENVSFNLDAPEVSAKLQTLQVADEATGGSQSPLDNRTSMEDDPDESSDSTSPENSKNLDYPSAKRLANRLFTLDGFKKSNVAVHLCKQ